MSRRNIVWGIIFIVAAILIVFSALGILGNPNPIKLIITLLLLPVIISNAAHLLYPGIFFPLAVIAIMYDDQLGIQALTPWPILFVALFLSIGLSFLFPHKFMPIRPKHWHRHWHKHLPWKESKKSDSNETDVNESVDETDDRTDGTINLSAKFNGSVKYINLTNLKEVNIDGAFSGIEVYFNEADISGEQAVVNVRLIFSGLDLYFPKNWDVIDNLNCIFGGVERKGSVSEKAEKKLILNGSGSYSGVSIHYI